LGDLREWDHLEDTGVDGIILKCIFRKWDGGMDWIGLAQNRKFNITAAFRTNRRDPTGSSIVLWLI
jgi:hypothetical protein